jgi:hypothetical protein
LGFVVRMSALTSKANRFGWIRYHSKPKSESDQQKVFARHVYLLPSVQELSLHISRRGAGVAGLRRFRFDVLPAIVHHNAQAKTSVTTVTDNVRRADLIVKLADGTSHQIDCRNKRDSVILEELYKLDPKSNKEPYVPEAVKVLAAKAQAKD